MVWTLREETHLYACTTNSDTWLLLFAILAFDWSRSGLGEIRPLKDMYNNSEIFFFALWMGFFGIFSHLQLFVLWHCIMKKTIPKLVYPSFIFCVIFYFQISISKLLNMQYYHCLYCIEHKIKLRHLATGICFISLYFWYRVLTKERD